MDALKKTFLEDPTYVYAALAVALLAAGVLWYETRRRLWGLSLLAPPVLAAGVFVLAALVQTDREKIVAAARQIARGIEKGDTSAMLVHLDEEFTGSLRGLALTKANVRAVADAERLSHNVVSIKFTRMEVEVSGPSARMHTVTVIRGSWEGVSAGRPIGWNLRWVRRQEGWRILKLDEPQFDLQP